MTEHLVRHQLESLAADDPHAPIAPALRAHVAGCDQCTTRLRALHASKARLLARIPADEFARATVARAGSSEPVTAGRRLHPKWLAAAAASGIAMAAVAAALWVGGHHSNTDIRLKGGVALQPLAKHAGRVARLQDGDALFEGDELAFEYSLDRPQHFMLLGIDDGGHVTRYDPPDATSLVPESHHGQLPIGIQLDARKGEERLYAVFSETRIDEAGARAALQRALESARAGGGGIATMDPLPRLAPDARTFSFWFRKP